MVILNIAKVSNNELNACRNNPCEERAPASDCCERSVSNSFFLFQPELKSACDGLFIWPSAERIVHKFTALLR